MIDVSMFLLPKNDKFGLLVVWTELSWILLGFFWTTGTGWNNSSASVSAIESCVNSRKSNENSKSAREGPRSVAKSETLVEMVSDKCLCAQRRGGVFTDRLFLLLLS